MEALFALVFVRVLVAYARRRDPLQRDLAVMFGAVAVLFALGVVRQVVGELPVAVGTLAAALLLGQPFLTVRLVRRVGAVPAAVYWSALAGWLISAALELAVGPSGGPAAIAVMVVLFVVT